MIDLDPTTLGLEFGGGAAIGGLIGFATKKLAKLLAVIVGVQLMLFRYLESQGILIVDWNRLSAGLLKTQTRAQDAADISWLQSMISTLSIGAGFTGGFLVGFKRG
ncbi:FUN14 domain-containing protein [Natrinema salsiterrestre]|uniref:FUN14 domain-containing protein n=1 Tax=Natrinema salsiterrestre TaxID=2950540 RepID=A0A9Q4L2N1_9EURY|nr:FUN14 domain-containing protein [Natrinema salsiterrestre]MDF9746512.1 FUN14 domain-containing protein [Natrinema salsiterrestre]